jgi:pyruvate-formate lyase-activating enzyme
MISRNDVNGKIRLATSFKGCKRRAGICKVCREIHMQVLIQVHEWVCLVLKLEREKEDSDP